MITMRTNAEQTAYRIAFEIADAIRMRVGFSIRDLKRTTSGRLFKRVVAILETFDDPRVQDFLDDAPTLNDVDLSVQLFGDERRRYEEIRLKKERKAQKRNLFPSKNESTFF